MNSTSLRRTQPTALRPRCLVCRRERHPGSPCAPRPAAGIAFFTKPRPTIWPSEARITPTPLGASVPAEHVAATYAEAMARS